MNFRELNNKISGIDETKIFTQDEYNYYLQDFALNCNNAPFNYETVIIVTSWHGHLMWLKNTLKQYRLADAFVICAYDNPIYCHSGASYLQINDRFPPADVFQIPHMWVFKHATFDADKRNGWFWDVKYAHDIIINYPNFKYVFCVNGDCIWERPEGLKDIIELLEENNGDLMADASSNMIHTCSVIYKISAFKKIVEFMIEKMKYPVIGSQSPEVMLKDAVLRNNLNEIKAPKQPIHPKDGSIDYYHCYNQDSTWKELLGFRNLMSEHIVCTEDGLEPLPSKYFDLRDEGKYLSGHEKLLLKYYLTNDRRYLYKYWDEGEDSWYNRVYHPIEFYGNEPIYEK